MLIQSRATYMRPIAPRALAALDRYFDLEVHPPGTPAADLDELYALRYAVFCEECGFLPPSDYPDQRESDAYDDRAVHIAARDSEGRVVGTTRLVSAAPDQPFPFESHCATFTEFQPPDPRDAVEVSRLAIRRDYRRRSGDTLDGVNPEHLAGRREPETQGAEKRVNAPLLLLGIYREMYRYCRDNDIRYWYAAMERPLKTVLRVYGVVFEAIGEEQDYCGPVTPYLADLRKLEQSVGRRDPELRDWFQGG